MLRYLIAVTAATALFGSPLVAQEDSSDEGGFLSRLKKVIEPEGEEKSWLERAKELGDSTLEKGKQSVEELLTNGSEANTQMAELLSYLDQKLVGREASFTDEEIQAMAVELIPLVEELNGREFKSTPEVATTGNFEMIQILGNDLVPQYQNQLPEVSKPSIMLRSYISAGLVAPALMGKYGVMDKVVYVLPENVRATMEETEIPISLEEDLMKIIIAHELTHALQDQEIDLNESVLEMTSPDESYAFQASIEGHAVYIQNAVAERLDLIQAADAGRKILSAPDTQEEAWLIDQFAMADAVRSESIYLGGENFISHHAAEGGIGKIWEILEAPPTQTSMIFKPATYTSDAAPAPDYTDLFSDAPGLLGIPEWEVEVHSMGDFDIVSHLGAVPKDQRDGIMTKLKKSAVLQFTHPSLGFGESLEAVIFGFSNAVGAEEMFTALEQLNENDLKSMEASLLVKLLSQRKIDYDADEGIAGTALRYETESPFLGEEVSSVFQVRRENLVIQIYAIDVDLKKSAIDAFLHASFDRFKSP